MGAIDESPDMEVFEWCPGALIRGGPQRESTGLALIVLNQPFEDNLAAIRQLWNNASVRIAADGGANRLYDAAGKHGDPSLDALCVIIGDLDSLRPETRAYYESRRTRVIQDPDQYSTDFGKAVHHIRQTHSGRPVDMLAIGGLGGRVDQGLSQIHHLYLLQPGPRYADGRLYLYSAESLTFLLKPGRHRIRVRGDDGGEDVFGKHVGILPVGRPCRITTRGLEWDVTDWETGFGGNVSTSNHVRPETRVVEVETTEDVVFTIALRGAA
ncbi:thiamine pyrophosphokinase [Trichocladium antarcticum]|uniref:Thiamine pyrophosphokinase n=1 Tax=Trichocladium antarcticum TaxID=1450529 RepID=A0AAN6Z9R8_9PEZI|nr:thiamine pyrophosphokinase [Trichocladium antarcticum]